MAQNPATGATPIEFYSRRLTWRSSSELHTGGRWRAYQPATDGIELVKLRQLIALLAIIRLHVKADETLPQQPRRGGSPSTRPSKNRMSWRSAWQISRSGPKRSHSHPRPREQGPALPATL